MPNELPLPDDLQHLLEKRERHDRRKADRRAQEADDDTDDAPRGKLNRRTGLDRRRRSRREEDQDD